MPTNTFVATANAVILSGNTPVFTDINRNTLCMSFESVQEHTDSETAAIILVHMGGLITPDYYKIKKHCDTLGLHLIEDAAHAHGASIDGIKAGNLGSAGCFSFYPTKIMTTGEGGMITTNDHKLCATARALRNHGENADGEFIYNSSNYRMSEINAVLGRSQLKRLKENIQKRYYLAVEYMMRLNSVSGITMLPTYSHIFNSYWNFFIVLDSNINRDSFRKELLNHDIQTGDAYYPGCHKMRVFEKYATDCPISDNILKRHVVLPMHVGMKKEDIIFIANSIKKAL